MKQNNSSTYYFLPIAFNILFLFSSCKEKPIPPKIEQYLGVNFPIGINEEHFLKAEYTSDYKRPYNIYGKYKIKYNDFQTLVENLGLISQTEDYRNMMCIKDISTQGFPYELWTFQTRFDYLSRKDFALKSWWHPEKNSAILYAAFYKEYGPKKIVRCYKEKQDGRILVSYNRSVDEAYILIEVLL